MHRLPFPPNTCTPTSVHRALIQRSRYANKGMATAYFQTYRMDGPSSLPQQLAAAAAAADMAAALIAQKVDAGTDSAQHCRPYFIAILS